MRLDPLHRLQQYRWLLRTKYLDRFAFVHINKTGGSSVERALRLPFRHRTARELRDELGGDEWRRRFSFAFVRNPWDRVASHYFYRVQTNRTGLGTDPVDFDEWVRRAYGERDPRYYDKPKMFMQQTEWICDEDGRTIVDMIGRFERLGEDFQAICDRIGCRAELPHLKQSSNRDYRRHYSPATAEIIGQRFARDIEEFGYSFD